MGHQSSATALLCAIPLMLAMLTLGVFATIARARIVKETLRLKTAGLYGDWARRHRVILLFERTVLVVFCASLVGILISPFVGPSFARLVFVPFVASGVLAPLSLYLSYRTLVK